MHPFPHTYRTTAAAPPTGDVALDSPSLPTLQTAGPAEFDGPGDRWSPETLLVGAVANCFILTFRSVTAASGFAWDALTCEATGTLDRVERVTRFTHIHLRATLTVPAGADVEKARALLDRAERICLVSNSLNAEVHLEAEVVSV